MSDEPLRMVAIQLPDDAMKSYRVLNGGNPDLYSVIVGLSRHADEYERAALANFGVIREDDDGMWALITDTTIEAIEEHLDEYNAALDAAVEEARVVREAAEAEDARIKEAAYRLRMKLRRDFGLPAA